MQHGPGRTPEFARHNDVDVVTNKILGAFWATGVFGLLDDDGAAEIQFRPTRPEPVWESTQEIWSNHSN
jgi:hypothetical protein